MTEFEVLVKEMRDTQKEYFRTRDKEVLKKSKSLEKQVDDCLDKRIGPKGQIAFGEAKRFDTPDQLNV